EVLPTGDDEVPDDLESGPEQLGLLDDAFPHGGEEFAECLEDRGDVLLVPGQGDLGAFDDDVPRALEDGQEGAGKPVCDGLSDGLDAAPHGLPDLAARLGLGEEVDQAGHQCGDGGDDETDGVGQQRCPEQLERGGGGLDGGGDGADGGHRLYRGSDGGDGGRGGEQHVPVVLDPLPQVT